MALTHWDPFMTLARLDENFDELVRRAWGTTPRTRTDRGSSGFVPAIEMRAEGSDVVITLELPGVDVANDVDIEVAHDRLVISGRRQDVNESNGEQGRLLVREFRYGSFRREFALPEGVTAEQVAASYDRGLLEVRIRNVAKPVMPPQKVAIRTADERQTIEGSAESSDG